VLLSSSAVSGATFGLQPPLFDPNSGSAPIGLEDSGGVGEHHRRVGPNHVSIVAPTPCGEDGAMQKNHSPAACYPPLAPSLPWSARSHYATDSPTSAWLAWFLWHPLLLGVLAALKVLGTAARGSVLTKPDLNSVPALGAPESEPLSTLLQRGRDRWRYGPEAHLESSAGGPQALERRFSAARTLSVQRTVRNHGGYGLGPAFSQAMGCRIEQRPRPSRKRLGGAGGRFFGTWACGHAGPVDGH